MELFFALKKPSVVVKTIKEDMVHNILKYCNSLLLLSIIIGSINLSFIYFYYSNEVDSGNAIVFANIFMIMIYLFGLFIFEIKKYTTHKENAYCRFLRNYMFMCTWISLLYAMALSMCWILVKVIFEFQNFYLNFESIYYALNLMVCIYMTIFTVINMFYSGHAK